MHVRIVMSGHGQGDVFVDGVKQERVVSVKFEAAVGDANLVTITQQVFADNVEIEGEVVSSS